MPTPIKINDQAKSLYELTAMLHCVMQIAEYSKDLDVHSSVRHRIKILMSAIKSFNIDITLFMKREDQEIWESDFKKTDIQVYGSIFHILTDMTDEQRQVVEEFAEQVRLGKVRVELDQQ